MPEPVELRPVEAVVIDASSPSGEAARIRGPDVAEMIVARLVAAETAWRSGDCLALLASARGLAAVSEDAGLVSVAGRASDIASAIGHADEVALAALVARLARVAEATVSAIWDEGHLCV